MERLTAVLVVIVVIIWIGICLYAIYLVTPK